MSILSAVNWSDTFVIAGLGISIVFFVLILLVGVLVLFSKIFSKKSKAVQPVAATVGAADTLLESKKAAIAMGLYLFYSDTHDEESYMMTICKHDDHSFWTSKLYGAHEY
jgi:Na+-transporting methylmalonyl-CoA/oxaloacetate decarboxylase gamma subunit